MKKIISAFISVLLISASLLCLASCFEEKEAQSSASVTESASADDGSAAVGTETEVTETEADTAAESAVDTSPESHTETETDAETQTDTELSESESTSGDTVPDPPGPDGRTVSYESFGAVGDGVTDDFNAILAAHEYANEHGLPVVARSGARYLFAADSVGRKIDIRTDTDWTGAVFIIDDGCVPVDENKYYYSPVFRVAPSAEGYSIKKVQSLKKGAEKLGYAPGVPCLAMISFGSSKVYIRTGVHAGNGEARREVFLVDGDGNIDGSTPINWDFNAVSSLILFPIDEKGLTVRGGEFITLSNDMPHKFTYFHRGIDVERSNTVVENVVHRVEGEDDEGGAPYNGFIYVYRCTGVTVRDCVFTPHYMFDEIKTEESTTFGYDVHAREANDVRFEGCTQTISIDDTNYWGVFTSNYSRNITLENCVLSRFDAHRGVYNVTIKDCTFGHQGIRFVGFGVCSVENTTVRSGQFINLRADYGSSFEGKIIIKNCRFDPQAQLWSKSELIYARNECDHYYGYKCYFPEIEINGLTVNDWNATSGYGGLYVLPVYTEKTDFADVYDNYKYHTPKEITIKNLTLMSGNKYRICRRPELYPGLKVK